jgi:hypothetical protein
VDRLDGLQIFQAVLGAPGAKAAGRARLSPAGVGVADLRGEEFEGAFDGSRIRREKRRQRGQLAGLDLGDELRHFNALYHE